MWLGAAAGAEGDILLRSAAVVGGGAESLRAGGVVAPGGAAVVAGVEGAMWITLGGAAGVEGVILGVGALGAGTTTSGAPGADRDGGAAGKNWARGMGVAKPA
jgi:hypothetical protein